MVSESWTSSGGRESSIVPETETGIDESVVRFRNLVELAVRVRDGRER